MSMQSTPPANGQDAGAAVDAYLDALLGAPPAAPAAAPSPPPAAPPQLEEPAQAQPVETTDATDNREDELLEQAADAPPPATEDAANAPAPEEAVAEPEVEIIDAPEAGPEAKPIDAPEAEPVAASPPPPAEATPEPEDDSASAPVQAPINLFPFLASAGDSDRPTAAPAPAGQRWLRLALGDDRYAVELLRVQEVVRLIPVIAMRGAAPSLLGVINLRGQVVPVHDLGKWLYRSPVEPDDRARIVVLEHQDELLGVLVSAVTDVVTLNPDQIEPPALGARDRIGMGIARTPGAPPTVLLDACMLFE